VVDVVVDELEVVVVVDVLVVVVVVSSVLHAPR
jgi:hypothetical protein